MSTHTPGPWHYESGAVWEHEGDSDTPDAVAIARRGDKSFQCYHRPGSESDANMRLISAAPELLQACKLLRLRLSDLIAHVEHETDSDADLAYHTDSLDEADAAIAKAEGRGE